MTKRELKQEVDQLRKAGIRYQQPLGKHRKITAHKGDIENYVRNRRDGRK